MLPNDLLRPEAWAESRPTHVELVETHISWVLLGDREVLKIKKPVELGFVDFKLLQRRREACDDEVRLNARLAPGVYLGVLPIVRHADGKLSVGGLGEIVDWAVHMRRLDDRARADFMLGGGVLTHDHIDLVARAIAELHRQTAVTEDLASRWASAWALESNVRDNFAQTAKFVLEYLDEGAANEVQRSQIAFLSEHGPLISERIQAGRIRDGHGDLRLEHVYFDDEGLRIIDCIEFDERYRIADVCSDVAFLSMDLAARGRIDLAEWFLARYARFSGDYDMYPLVDFYEGYRAWVRAKVSAMLAQDPGAGEDARRRAADEARRHFLLALACTRSPLVPLQLVCVGGMIGSGKSTVAETLSRELSWPVIDSDRARKQLLGVEEKRALLDPAWSGAYGPDVTVRVYAETLRRASVVLASRRSVVIDASFRSAAARRGAQELARAHGAAFLFVECRAPLDVCRARLTNRSKGPSDGRPAILDDFIASFEPVTELASTEHVVLDTARPVERSIDELLARLQATS